MGLAQAGHPLLPHDRKIAADGSAEHIVPITRNALCQRGINLAAGLEGKLKVGDILAVYVEDTTEQMMLGKILELEYTITEADAVYSWMGQMEVGDRVILLHKFDPIGPNGISSRYWHLKDPAKKATQFPIWIEDVRAVHIKLAEDKVRRGRSTVAAVNPIDVRWEISSGERERFLVTLPLVMQSASEDLDPHAHQRRKAEFVQGDAEGASDSGASGVEGASDGGAEGEDN